MNQIIIVVSHIGTRTIQDGTVPTGHNCNTKEHLLCYHLRIGTYRVVMIQYYLQDETDNSKLNLLRFT
jgi:hypothetical protein